MRLSEIWWKRVENAASVPDKVRASLETGKSVILCCEGDVPWKREFYERMNEEISAVSADKSIVTVSAAGVTDPAAFILTSQCPDEVREKYWPDETVAGFLAAQDGISLNSKIIMVSDITDANKAVLWLKFVKEYSAASEKYGSPRAQFLIDLSCADCDPDANNYTDKVTYSVSEFDRYIFCMSILSDSKMNITMKKYVAELACLAGGNDAEYCGALAQLGEELVRAPFACINKIQDSLRSDGTVFGTASREETESFVIQSQIKVFFPGLEKIRMGFIKERYTAIAAGLPVINCFGEKINEPYGLEFADLIGIERNACVGFSDTDREFLKNCRELRNKIAHKTVLTQEEMKFIEKHSSMT